MNATEPQSYQDFQWWTRAFGVLGSPRSTFEAVAAKPCWARLMSYTLLITAACGVLLLQTDVGRQALVDQWERTAVAFGQPVDDRQYAQFETMSENGAAYAVGSALLRGPVLSFGLAAVLLVVFSCARRGQASYRQVLAVVVHAGVILALREVVAAPASYMRETLASPTTFTLFFPMLDEASPAARFFGIIDLFVVWWVIALAIGMAILYRRPARPLALTFIGVYVAFASMMAIAMVTLGGTT